MPLLVALIARTSHRMTEVAFLIALLGSLAIASSALPLPLLRRTGLIVGGLLLAVGFALFIIVVHSGDNPFPP